MLKRSFVLIVACVATAAAAQVPPQYNVPWAMPQTLHWGDTAAQMSKISGVTIERDGSKNVSGLHYGGRASLSLWGLPFDVQFFFTPLRDALAMIRLKPTDPNRCSALRAEIQTLAPSIQAVRTSPLSESQKYLRPLNHTEIEFLTMYRANQTIWDCAILLRSLGT